MVVAHKDGTLELFNTNDLEGLMNAGRSEVFQPPFRVEAGNALSQAPVDLRATKSSSGNLVAVLNSKSGGREVMVLEYIAPREAKEEDWLSSTLNMRVPFIIAGAVLVVGYRWYKRKQNQPEPEGGDPRRKQDNRNSWNPS